LKISNWQKIKSLLLKSDIKRLSLLLIPMSITALVNIFGIAFVMPFIAVASNPEMIHSNSKLGFVYHLLGFTQPAHFIVFLGVLALIMLVLADSLAALTTWFSAKAIENVRARIIYTLYERYLNRSYEYHLNNNSTTLSNNLFAQVERFTNGYIFQGAHLLSSILSTVTILGLIIYLNPMLALVTAVTLGSMYTLIYFSIKKTLDNNSRILVSSSEATYRLASESFGGIKDIKLKGCEGTFKKLFLPQLMAQARSTATSQCITTLPKYALEVIAFGGIIIMMLTMILSGQTTTTIIPILSVYVYAGYRLMPVMQQLFASAGAFRTASGPLNAVYNSIKDGAPTTEPVKQAIHKMNFERQFKITGLSYNYTGFDRVVLNDVNLTVNHNEIVGVIGSTGAGKTTLIDVILGLLKPTEGTLSVDGINLDSPEKVSSWQKGMGYVPQFIFLSDSTIKENIAFGEDPKELDMSRIKKSASIAAIHDFITKELPDGYDTVVGERGVKLSGGQIQRIGIARALYNDPSILVLDEATSSLDSQTEKEVMQAIYNMKDKITIIIIAHRLSTVACCDRVFLMEEGQIIDEGTFPDLASRHDALRQQSEETVAS
jgi:ATP-binding cassette, subfamily B, bacterial PglK